MLGFFLNLRNMRILFIQFIYHFIKNNMKQKRLFIKTDADPRKLAQTLQFVKALRPDNMHKFINIIFESKLDGLIVSGVKRKRIRKKIIKREIQRIRETLIFDSLNMMEERWVDKPTPEVETQLRDDFLNFVNSH